MSTDLRLGAGLTLPLDIVTEATAIVATRGAGKSSTGAVLVEEAIAAAVPIVVIDWTGVFWGLRSSAKGDKAGLAIYVLGGPHGDVPLEASAGNFIADLVVDSGHSFVLDLSDFTKGQMRRFCADFLERIYERKARARTTLLLLIDEAHELAPQSPRGGFKGDAARLIGAMEQVAALGRSRGIGVVMITQRTQALNKAVLDLIETLLVMRMLSPRAVAAVRDWILGKNEDDEQGVLASLRDLPTGTAWVWSPLRGILQKVAVRRIRTFDSYATPKPGEVRVEPKARKELDLGALGEQMRATVERAKADDPVELRAQVSRLQRELAAEQAKPTPEPVVERLEVPVLAPEIVDQLQSLLSPATDLLGELQETMAKHRAWAEQQLAGARDSRAIPDRPRGQNAKSETPRSEPTKSLPSPVSVHSPDQGDVHLKAGARRILTTLADHHPMRVTKSQLGMLAKFKITGGTFQTYWGQIKRLGFIDESDGDIGLTQAGFDHLGMEPPAPLSAAELLARWRKVLKAGARNMLDVLVEQYPDSVSREDLAERVGMTASGGTFQTYLGTLRRNGLAQIDDRGIVADDSLTRGAS